MFSHFVVVADLDLELTAGDRDAVFNKSCILAIVDLFAEFESCLFGRSLASSSPFVGCDLEEVVDWVQGVGVSANVTIVVKDHEAIVGFVLELFGEEANRSCLHDSSFRVEFLLEVNHALIFVSSQFAEGSDFGGVGSVGEDGECEDVA